jgi:hypothetical protein
MTGQPLPIDFLHPGQPLGQPDPEPNDHWCRHCGTRLYDPGISPTSARIQPCPMGCPAEGGDAA